MNIKKIILFSLIFVIYGVTICHAQELNIGALDKIDIAGNNFLMISRRIAKWIVIVMCVMECIKCALNHNKNGVGQALMTYGMIYGAIFFVPYIMEIIEGIFSW